MEPKKIKIIKETFYWQCTNPSHRHKTKIIAAKCIKKYDSRKLNFNNWNELNFSKIIELRDSGLTFKEIGKYFNGITASHARCRWMAANRFFSRSNQ